MDEVREEFLQGGRKPPFFRSKRFNAIALMTNDRSVSACMAFLNAVPRVDMDDLSGIQHGREKVRNHRIVGDAIGGFKQQTGSVVLWIKPRREVLGLEIGASRNQCLAAYGKRDLLPNPFGYEHHQQRQTRIVGASNKLSIRLRHFKLTWSSEKGVSPSVSQMSYSQGSLSQCLCRFGEVDALGDFYF